MFFWIISVYALQTLPAQPLRCPYNMTPWGHRRTLIMWNHLQAWYMTAYNILPNYDDSLCLYQLTFTIMSMIICAEFCFFYWYIRSARDIAHQRRQTAGFVMVTNTDETFMMISWHFLHKRPIVKGIHWWTVAPPNHGVPIQRAGHVGLWWYFLCCYSNKLFNKQLSCS